MRLAKGVAEDKNKKRGKCWVYAQRGVVWIKKANGRERDREVSNQEGVSHMRGLDL